MNLVVREFEPQGAGTKLVANDSDALTADRLPFGHRDTPVLADLPKVVEHSDHPNRPEHGQDHVVDISAPPTSSRFLLIAQIGRTAAKDAAKRVR